jgi:hypothetical protein
LDASRRRSSAIKPDGILEQPPSIDAHRAVALVGPAMNRSSKGHLSSHTECFPGGRARHEKLQDLTNYHILHSKRATKSAIPHRCTRPSHAPTFSVTNQRTTPPTTFPQKVAIRRESSETIQRENVLENGGEQKCCDRFPSKSSAWRPTTVSETCPNCSLTISTFSQNLIISVSIIEKRLVCRDSQCKFAIRKRLLLRENGATGGSCGVNTFNSILHSFYSIEVCLSKCDTAFKLCVFQSAPITAIEKEK